MAVVLAAYHIFLKREKMHRFNRFYLLFALALSLGVPFITIEIAGTVISKPITLAAMPFKEVVVQQAQVIASKKSTDYVVIALWSLYSIVTLFLAARFVKNIRHFMRKAKQNPQVQYEKATLVLLPEKILPHTFLNYIFISKEDYDNNAIENELYTHELTHVKQKHTLDILFIEVLKTVFWFNPLLYFYKRSIQLNHEFLADEKVVSSFNDTVFYQKLLLEKAEVNCTFYLASNLTYSITKQRLLMMTKSTSRTRSALIKVVLAPVILLGLCLFLSLKNVENPKADNASSNALPSGKHPSQEQWNNWKSDANTIIWINNWQMKKSDLDQFNADDVLSYSDDFIKTNSGTNGVKQQEVFLYTKQGFEDHYNSLEWPKPIEYKEILKLRPKEGC